VSWLQRVMGFNGSCLTSCEQWRQQCALAVLARCVHVTNLGEILSIAAAVLPMVKSVANFAAWDDFTSSDC
jgi:hypothetical protein